MSYQVSQIRIAEAFTILPFFFPEAIWGIFLGVFIANIFSPFGWIDMVFGSLISLLAAFCTYLVGKALRPKLSRWGFVTLAIFLAPLFPVLFNSFGVSFYLLKFGLVSNYTYWGALLSILIGEAISCYLLGGPLMLALILRYRKTGALF